MRPIVINFATNCSRQRRNRSREHGKRKGQLDVAALADIESVCGLHRRCCRRRRRRRCRRQRRHNTHLDAGRACLAHGAVHAHIAIHTTAIVFSLRQLIIHSRICILPATSNRSTIAVAAARRDRRAHDRAVDVVQQRVLRLHGGETGQRSALQLLWRLVIFLQQFNDGLTYCFYFIFFNKLQRKK